MSDVRYITYVQPLIGAFLLYVYKDSYLHPYDSKLSLLSIYQKSLLHYSPFPSESSLSTLELPSSSEGLATLRPSKLSLT